MTKPTFIVGKGHAEQIETRPVLEHYRRIFRGLLAWDGEPDGCPDNFANDCIFFTGGCGVKRMRGFGPVMTGISPSTLTVYGMPYHWIPQPIGMTMNLTGSFFEATNDPCLWLGESISSLIDPYVKLMETTIKTLNQNLYGLQQPIAIKGIPGAELPGKVMLQSISDGDVFIPSVGAAFNVEVLDLKAQDHTQNLISTIDWCDARILEVMMSSNGVEKASGITTLETVSGVQSIIQEFDDLLERCKAFCDDVNDKFGMSLSVRAGEGIRTLTEPSQPVQTDTEDEQDAAD